MVKLILNDMVHLEDLFIAHNWKQFTLLRCHLAKSMWHDKHDIFVSLCEFFFDLAVTWICKEVYSPANVLCALDMADGQLSIEDIEVLCTCKTNDTKYYCNSILPCSAEI